MLSNSNVLTIKDALYSPRSRRMLLSFKDIRDNNYYAETSIENKVKFMCIASYEYSQKRILEKTGRLLSGLYTTTIDSIESHYVAGLTSQIVYEVFFWSDHL